MKIPAADPDAYFASLPNERREPLERVRAKVRAIWPKASEKLVNGIPTYHLDGHPLCALANQKSFMVLYIMPYDLLDAFNKDLKAYDRGRSCIRFRRLEPETLELFDRILKYTGGRHMESIYYGRGVRPNHGSKRTTIT